MFRRIRFALWLGACALMGAWWGWNLVMWLVGPCPVFHPQQCNKKEREKDNANGNTRFHNWLLSLAVVQCE